MAPPAAVKDKHVRLRVAPALNSAAPDFTPRCHPERQRPFAKRDGEAEQNTSSWRNNIVFKAMGWRMKESCDRLQLLAGDRLDIAYSPA